jgi:hypothetical protein
VRYLVCYAGQVWEEVGKEVPPLIYLFQFFFSSKGEEIGRLRYGDNKLN